MKSMNYSSRNLLDIYVITALATVLLTRLFLELTGYPQLGGGGLHIAHVLWGGLLMMVATLLLLLSDGRHKFFAAVAGGVGFGLFIDEIGKFVTSDVDYFFRPAAVMIYLIIVLLWLGARLIITRAAHQPLLPPVAWPTNAWQRRFVVTMLVLLGVGAVADVGLLVYDAITPPLFGGIFGTTPIGYVLYVLTALYVGAVMYALGHIARGDRSRGLSLIRELVILTIVINLPFSVYKEQFVAFGSLIVYVLFLVSVTNRSEWQRIK